MTGTQAAEAEIGQAEAGKRMHRAERMAQVGILRQTGQEKRMHAADQRMETDLRQAREQERMIQENTDG